MVRILLIHLCLVGLVMGDVCPKKGAYKKTPGKACLKSDQKLINLDKPDKILPAHIPGGMLHITAATSPDSSGKYVLEVTDFDLDTPVKVFVDYGGAAITDEKTCGQTEVSMYYHYFVSPGCCWHPYPFHVKSFGFGAWVSGKCTVYVEVPLLTPKAFAPEKISKVRVVGSASRNGYYKKVRVGVISFQ